MSRSNLKMLIVTTTLLALPTWADLLPNAGNYAIDASHTSVNFRVDHMGYSKILGRFGDVSGTLAVSEQGSGKLNVIINTASVDTNHDKRDDHLRSPDFFNAKQFPEITFTSALKINGNTEKQQLNGEVEILGVKRPVLLTVQKGKEGNDPWGLYRIGYSASTILKRSEFGMDFMSGGIGDAVEIEIQLEAIKQ